MPLAGSAASMQRWRGNDSSARDHGSRTRSDLVCTLTCDYQPRTSRKSAILCLIGFLVFDTDVPTDVHGRWKPPTKRILKNTRALSWDGDSAEGETDWVSGLKAKHAAA